ncbi:MAG: hypothetical protein HHJ18_03850 [Polaromonas sp.]|nr:hypothetical protein [Polaromonas sp.]
MAIATIIGTSAKLSGGANTPRPIPMAAIMRGGPHGLPPTKSGTITISSIMKTAPAMMPDQIAELQSIDCRAVTPEVTIASPLQLEKPI